MKLLLLFNQFFLYLSAFHQNLNFLEQTCSFLHLLTQQSSLSYVCFIRRGILNFAVTFLFCRDFFVFAVAFLFCREVFILPWLVCFAMAFSFLP